MVKSIKCTTILWIGMFILLCNGYSFAAQVKTSNPVNNIIDSLIATVPNLMRSDVNGAKKTILKINQLSQEANYQHGKIEGTFDRCWLLYHNGYIDQCIVTLDSAINNIPNIYREPSATKFNILKGQCYVKKEQFNMAVREFSVSLKQSEKNKDVAGRAGALVSIGWAYMEDNKPSEAISFFMEILKIKSSDQYLNKATVLNNIAACYNILGKYQNAANYAQMGVKEARGMNSLVDLANGLNILAGAIYQQGKVKQALSYLSEASKVREKVGDPAMLASDYMELSDIYRKSRQFAPSIAYARKAVALSIKNNINLKLESAYSTLATSLEDAGQYKLAAIYYKKLLAYKDSANNAANNKAMAELLVKYNTQKKTTENLQLKQDNLSARLRLISKQRWLTITISIAVLIILSSIFLYIFIRSRYKTRLVQQQIAEQKNRTLAVLETEENERKRIAADLHDGVCQMLATVSVQLKRTIPSIDTAQHLLEQAAEEVRAVSHRMTPELLKHYGLAKAIEESLLRLNSSNSLTTFVFYNNAELEGIEELLQVIIFRAFQELINNIIKHARATEVNVHLTVNEENVILLIEDNGVGFSAGNNHAGLGLKSLMNRVNAFDGVLTIDSMLGKGTTVILTFDDPVLI